MIQGPVPGKIKPINSRGLPCKLDKLRKRNMTRTQYTALAALATVTLSTTLCVWKLQAADAEPATVKDVMKAYHKAPEGVDPICKKALASKATPEELKKLVAGYRVLAKAKAPKGDEASWKDKTSKLLAAAEAVEKHEPDAIPRYKEAINCKACHSAHKPD